MSPSSPPQNPPSGDQKALDTPRDPAHESAETETKLDANSIAEESVSSEENDSAENTDALGRTVTTRVSRTSASASVSEPSLTRRVTSAGSIGTTDPRYEIDWEDETDPEDPRNWPLAYKAMLIFFLSWNTLIVVLYSTSYTSGVSVLAKEFETSSIVMTLGLTFYLVGLAAGSMILAPLTEMYGRKPVSLTCLFFFTVLIIPCALSTSIAELIIVRFLSAFFGSVLVSAGPGLVADLVNEEHRALAISIWSVGPMNGPVLGPILGGFVTQYLSWRWMDWIVLILAGAALIFTIFMKETYTPILLKRKAARLRKMTGDTRWWSQYDQKGNLLDALKVNLVRPTVMAVTEPICIFWNLYVGVVYGILYLCFVAYPIVFRQIRGWPLGLSGLGFLGIGVGIFITIFCEPLIRRMINSHKPDPQTGKPPPEAMVSIICISSILIPIGELWFAWTCSPKSIHWIAPIIAGVFFGAGNTGVFIYASNYLAGSYGMFAASALAGNSVIRSVLGGVLPLAGSPMYDQMGANWAGTLLGLLEVALIPIPFVFWGYGHKIRMRSPIIMMMQTERDRMERRRERMVQRLATVHVRMSGQRKETEEPA